jgi:hypothetical protein
MSASTVTIKAAEEAAADVSPNDVSILPTIPIFIPSLDYVTGVPPDLLPPIFPTDDPISRLGLGGADRASEDDPVAENYEELYSKLIASTARDQCYKTFLSVIFECS